MQNCQSTSRATDNIHAVQSASFYGDAGARLPLTQRDAGRLPLIKTNGWGRASFADGIHNSLVDSHVPGAGAGGGIDDETPLRPWEGRVVARLQSRHVPSPPQGLFSLVPYGT